MRSPMPRASWAFLVDSVPFTKAVRDGETSLGGSESACLGLARALLARGHEVHVFATQLEPDAVGPDAWGVAWHPLDEFTTINNFIEFDVVVGLRQPGFFQSPMQARLRVLWNQDLLTPGAGSGVMAIGWALDKIVYVSEYHRRQWEAIQSELKPLGAVTKNGYDPVHVPIEVTKDPNRIIHISRPERGLAPLLAMWPAFKARNPKATLQICRYQSMYDGEGTNVRATCLSFDEHVKAVNAEVGGIEYLGSLNKAQLYKAIAEAAVMWYPGIASFAETSCIAAIEAQACGTPFVGSVRGALPETAYPSFEAGLLIPGDAYEADYQNASIKAVERMLDGCARQTFEYRKLQQAGRKFVETYTYQALAAEWETMVDGWFADRYEANKLRVMRQLLHEDDHTTALVVAHELMDSMKSSGEVVGRFGGQGPDGESVPRADLPAAANEAYAAALFCTRVIQGREQGAEAYASHAIQDPLREVELSGRFRLVAPYFKDCKRVLDVACGNGAGAIRFAMEHPELHVVGIDYAEGNIAHAREAAERAGVADRCTFVAGPVWDFDRDAPHDDGNSRLTLLSCEGDFDGLFVGEFVEHVADCAALVDFLEQFLAEGAQVIYTCPVGPFVELASRGMYIQRGHVHCFRQDDVHAVWGGKKHVGADFMEIGLTPRGHAVGHWIIHYRTAAGRKAGDRDYATRAKRTRPQQKLSVGLIAKDAENDLGRCLSSVWAIADEIVVGDTGSSDTTAEIAKTYGAHVLELPAVEDIREGFAGARNAVLGACTGDWFLWIDADEQLINSWKLRGFLEGPLFNGYVLHQNHVYIDGPPTFDVPVRLFRHGQGTQFYGCIHEQPQAGSPNADIVPCLDLTDPSIAHTGYLTAEGREEKRVSRNRPLLLRDQQVFPDRLLGKVLLLREAVIEADAARMRTGGRVNTRAAQGYQHAIDLFVRYFDDPTHKFAKIARPWYEAALQHLGVGWEIELALAGTAGTLGANRAKPERVWVRDGAEFERLMQHRVTTAATKMQPVRFATESFPPEEAPVTPADLADNAFSVFKDTHAHLFESVKTDAELRQRLHTAYRDGWQAFEQSIRIALETA
jgi:glycosyltransferase involved in cell wall biosynthesis/2-polyprenyl-3-methyl-5-hydroxy-6-metoxy-1,4-benzoquinol methylase